MADTPGTATAPDLLDDAAESPQPDAAPAEALPPQQQGPDLLDDVAAQDQEASGEQPGSASHAADTWWQTVASKLDSGLLSKVPMAMSPKGEIQNVGDVAKQADDAMDKIVQHEIAQAHPYRAQMAQFFKGSAEDAGKIVDSLTSPLNLAMTVASAGANVWAKGALTAANLYFAMQGGHELIRERQEGETAADYAQRVTSGGAGLLFGLAGVGSESAGWKRAMHNRVQTKLGISGDLASKVADKVTAIEGIRQQGAKEASGEVLKASQDAGDLLDQAEKEQAQAKTTISSSGEEIPIRVGQILRDAVHAVYTEQARVNKPFEEMARDAKGPISDAQSMRATITEVVKAHGVQDHEIPAKIFDALAERGKGSNSVNIMGKEVGPGDPLFEKLKSQGALGDTGNAVSFSDATRVRGDLYDAAQAAKGRDTTVSNALFDAYDSVTKMQEDYAEKNGFAEKYRAAKNDYKNFKRELGSGQMKDFTKAEDYKQQAMAPRVAKLLRSVDAESLRGLLKIVGIDVSPLDSLVAKKAGAEAVLKTSQSAADRAAGGLMKKGLSEAARKTQATEKEARTLGKNNPVVLGVNDLDLQGKTTAEIRRQAIDHIVTNAKAGGISNPMGMFMLIYGTLRMGMGSPFGIYPAIRGGTGVVKSTGARLLRTPAYQDWLIRESGVDPSNLGLINKLRRGLAAMASSADNLARHPEKLTEQEE